MLLPCSDYQIIANGRRCCLYTSFVTARHSSTCNPTDCTPHARHSPPLALTMSDGASVSPRTITPHRAAVNGTAAPPSRSRHRQRVRLFSVVHTCHLTHTVHISAAGRSTGQPASSLHTSHPLPSLGSHSSSNGLITRCHQGSGQPIEGRFDSFCMLLAARPH